LQAFERGVNLTRTCQKALQEAEQKVQILIDKNGSQVLEPFADE
jgi:exodeoxyribonuclease VII small subunit